MNNTYKSSSHEHQAAEAEIKHHFMQTNHLIAEPPMFPTPFPAKFDGTYKNSAGEWIFIEIYAHQGPLKSAQRQKVCTDILKLVTAEQLLTEPIQKYVLFGCAEAMKSFQNNSWYTQSVDKWKIKLEVGILSEGTKLRLKAAQERQKMVNVAD
ncbi:MAG: hypothetical protein ACI351_05115 [Candidatus Avelusimicrobium sp.]|uniref:hypothetical protein n=1 Tax=Candidatus Avelusimicrobium sp. TaxID=3048833 RepID=UPI003F0C6B00